MPLDRNTRNHSLLFLSFLLLLQGIQDVARFLWQLIPPLMVALMWSKLRDVSYPQYTQVYPSLTYIAILLSRLIQLLP